jgi:nucleotide-binding universal stress UspA family protein
MRVLCAIGVRGGAELVRRTAARICGDAQWHLLHVIDVGPRVDMERLGPAHRPPRPHRPHERELNRAEGVGGEEALKEALDALQALGLKGEARLERGRPNEVIVEMAQRVNADLIAIERRERADHLRQGPASLGHNARFIVDHAPCDVLLLRTGYGYGQ